MKSELQKLVWFIVLIAVLVSVSLKASAATINVTNTSGFQAALTASQGNGEDDTINVSAGTYNISATLTYSSAEDHSLTINGAGAGSTILDGNNSHQIMNLVSDGAGSFTVSGMTSQNGRVTGAAAMGGGLLVVCNGSGSITIDSGTFANNSSAMYAAGAYTAVRTGTITVTDSTFDGNTIDTGGDDAAGIEVYIENGGHAFLSNNTFSNNIIGNSPGGSCDGAGLFIYLFGTGGSITIENNTITANSSNNGIGGLFCRIPNQGDLVVRNNIFRENISGTPSAGYGAGGAYIQMENGLLTIANNQFLKNEAKGPEGDGGGLWIELNAGTANITANVFANNSADRNGGGASVYFSSGTTAANIVENLFVNNQADSEGGSGGGIIANSDISSVSLINNTYYGNSASEAGGMGFYTETAGNSLNLYNEIYWNNLPNSIANLGVGTIRAEYSNIEGDTGQSWFGTACIDTNPSFVNPSDPDGADDVFGTTDDGLRLAEGSPCINTGITPMFRPQ